METVLVLGKQMSEQRCTGQGGFLNEKLVHSKPGELYS